jgi:uncharacterized protein (TIGR03000 family)
LGSYGGYSPWYGGYYSPSYYSDYGYSYPSSDYAMPDYSASYPPPDTTLEQSNIEPNAARIRVIVPNPDATVWFNKHKTSTPGTTRMFHTPALEAGKYTYTIKASWNEGGKTVTQERKVDVSPGKLSEVDFTRPPRTGGGGGSPMPGTPDESQ